MSGMVVSLKTISLNTTMPTFMDTPQRAIKRRVFTEDEWRYLNTRSTKELLWRIRYGDTMIKLLYRPELINMTAKEADMLSSNLRYQQDAIREIIKTREVTNGSR